MKDKVGTLDEEFGDIMRAGIDKLLDEGLASLKEQSGDELEEFRGRREEGCEGKIYRQEGVNYECK